jgi:hypothetical protein
LPAMIRDFRRQLLRITNYNHFLVTTEIEQSREAVTARKSFWEADRLYRRGDRSRAMAKYEDKVAFGPAPTWRPDRATGFTRIFYTHPEFRNDELSQEDAYDLQLKYIDAATAQRGPRLRRMMQARPIMAAVMAPSLLPAAWIPAVDIAANAVSLHLAGPFDGFDPHQQPWIGSEAIRIVNMRRGISEPSQQRSAPPVAMTQFGGGARRGGPTGGMRVGGGVIDR